MRQICSCFWAATVLWVGLVPVAWGGGEWGSLKGQFVYGGDPPEPARLSITKDEEVCCQHQLVDESLVVDGKTHGLQNVVIFLYPKANEVVDIHEEYQLEAARSVKLDNLACRFEPRVVLLWKSQTLLVGNSDPVAHNAMIDTRKNSPVNVTIPSGGQSRHRFSRQERGPVSVSCSIHPWMRGWLLVRDTPYMAVSDAQGRFEIQNVPAGEWEFAVWHERAKFVTDVVREGKEVRWKRGRVKVTIGPKSQDLGRITLPAKTLTR